MFIFQKYTTCEIQTLMNKVVHTLDFLPESPIFWHKLSVHENIIRMNVNCVNGLLLSKRRSLAGEEKITLSKATKIAVIYTYFPLAILNF